MSKQFSADSEANDTLKGERGNARQAQLLVLLLLLAVGGYLYFFTGLIKPREEAPKAQPAQSAPVKKPMPPRQAEQKPGVAVEKPSQPTPAAVPAPAPVQNAGGQKPAPAQTPAKPEPVKTTKIEGPAGQKTPIKPAATAAVKTNDKKPAKEAVSAKAAGKAAAPVVQKQAEKPADKKVAGAYSLKIGEYVFAKDVVSVEAKLKKAGIKPVVQLKKTKAEPMNRLFYAEYPDRESAGADLEQLRAKAPDAFIIQENGKYVIYAGSYLKEGRGAIEQDRLFDKGVRLVMKKTEVKIPVTVLTAGSFTSQEDARNAAARLKKSGINASVIMSGKKTGKK